MSHPRESLTSPNRIRAAERARQALELRKGGATYDTIAQKAGYRTAGGAYRAIQRAMLKIIQEPAEDVRKLELMRLDRMFLAIWTEAKRGDLSAVEKALAIMARRAKLLGLDAPTTMLHMEVTVDWDSLTREELARIASGESPSIVTPRKCHPIR